MKRTLPGVLLLSFALFGAGIIASYASAAQTPVLEVLDELGVEDR